VIPLSLHVWFLDLGVPEYMYSIGSFGYVYVCLCVYDLD